MSTEEGGQAKKRQKGTNNKQKTKGNTKKKQKTKATKNSSVPQERVFFFDQKK